MLTEDIQKGQANVKRQEQTLPLEMDRIIKLIIQKNNLLMIVVIGNKPQNTQN